MTDYLLPFSGWYTVISVIDRQQPRIVVSRNTVALLVRYAKARGWFFWMTWKVSEIPPSRGSDQTGTGYPGHHIPDGGL